MSAADESKWEGIYTARRDIASPSSALVALGDEVLPRYGAALDLAGGSGRNALWLAARGLDVTLIDVSKHALAMAQAEAAARGLSLRTRQADLDTAKLEGLYELVLCCNFLDRELLATIAGHVAGEGLFVMLHPTRRNLERHPKPSAAFLLEEGELPSLLSGLSVVHTREAWSPEGRHEALVVARREA